MTEVSIPLSLSSSSDDAEVNSSNISGSAASSESSSLWGFNVIPSPEYTKETVANMDKWGLTSVMKVARFSYDRAFKPYHAPELIKSLFHDHAARQHIQICVGRDAWIPVDTILPCDVDVEEIACTKTNIEMFNKFKDIGCVRGDSGRIIKCFDECVDGMMMSDELHRTLACEDSETYEEFDEEQRDEFMFRLLKHLVLGGSVCQYEDYLEPYTDAVKDIYKSLIAVRVQQGKNGERELETVSSCYRVSLTRQQEEADGAIQFYPGANDTDHPQNFCYVCVDPLRRHVNVVYGAWVP